MVEARAVPSLLDGEEAGSAGAVAAGGAAGVQLLASRMLSGMAKGSGGRGITIPLAGTNALTQSGSIFPSSAPSCIISTLEQSTVRRFPMNGSSRVSAGSALLHGSARLWLIVALAAGLGSPTALAQGFSNTCEFAYDGECDEPGIGTGACAAGTDDADCSGSVTAYCEFMYDGECDEPGIGTGLCAAGTDTADCSSQSDTYRSSPSGTFEFEVCNRDYETAYVAIATPLSPGSGDHLVEGWWEVSPGSCEIIGDFYKGWIYYYAEADSGEWSGSGLNLCVQQRVFERVNRAGYTCAGHERLEGFVEKLVEEDRFTWNLNP